MAGTAAASGLLIPAWLRDLLEIPRGRSMISVPAATRSFFAEGNVYELMVDSWVEFAVAQPRKSFRMMGIFPNVPGLRNST